MLERQFAAGGRVIAVARGDANGRSELTADDEHDLVLAGLLVFVDSPKDDAADALARLNRLEVEVKVMTGDNDRVAQKVCSDLGLTVRRTLTGSELDRLSDAQLGAALPHTTIFARVTPEQKSRVITAQRRLGTTVGFLGDGVNDAVALHDADVGVPVLRVPDGGVLGGGGGRMLGDRRCAILGLDDPVARLAVLTCTRGAGIAISGRAATRSVLLPGIAVIGDIMIWGFDAGPDLFRSGWFVESLATRSLVIFAIRTRRVPFIRSRPSAPLLISTLTCVTVGVLLPFSPLADTLGFTALPAAFMVARWR